MGEGGLSAAAPLSRARERALLAAILLASLAVRLWGLEQNGWGAAYYSAAVRSMAAGAHNFLFAAFDPAGFISVDKPPVALWLQVASVKVLGFHPTALLLPQALAGVAAVAVLYLASRPAFGAAPALAAALFFGLSPAWVAVNRTNNVDSCLLLVLLLAAWATLRSIESGGRRPWLAAMAAVGIAFNVKMLAGLVVLPALVLTWLAFSPLPWRRRLADLAAGGALVIAVSAPWVLLVECTPADQRPYVGSSRSNSMLELVAGHNAASRFSRPATALAVPAPRDGAADDEAEPDTRSLARALAQRLFVRTPTGWLRPAYGLPAAQYAWLLPLALAGVVFGLRRGDPGGGAPDRRARAATLLWLAWALTYWIVYANLGGIVHFYYFSTLAPALAALAAAGLAALAARWHSGSKAALLLPAALLATAGWQLHVQSSAMGPAPEALSWDGVAWYPWLRLAMLAGTAAGVLGLVGAWQRSRRGKLSPALARGSLALGTLALLVFPSAWVASVVLLPAHGVMPSADLFRLAIASYDRRAVDSLRLGLVPDTAKLAAFLRANRTGERYLLTTTTTQVAAPLIIETGEPVLARGGFHGLDGAITADGLERLVRSGELRFAMTGDLTAANRRMGARAAARPVDDWIRAHGRLVDPSHWRPERGATGMRLYDLRPDRERVAPP